MSETGTHLCRRTDPYLRHCLHAVVGRVKVSHDQEHDLVLRVQAGDRAALDQLIDANLSFDIRVSRRSRHRGLSDRDLIAEGTLGLIMAARRVVPAPGSRFIAVGVRWIHRAIQAAITEQVRTTAFTQPFSGDWR
jgi:DNA-directed RNA polymerase sigma subunit (sigma70/sigma32)